MGAKKSQNADSVVTMTSEASDALILSTDPISIKKLPEKHI